MGSGHSRDGDGDDEEDGGTGEPLVNYRGQIPQSDWVEFKRNVPRTINLTAKINELIRQFNDEQRDDENENNSSPNNQDG